MKNKRIKWILLIIVFVIAILLNQYLEYLDYLQKLTFESHGIKIVFIDYVVLNTLFPYIVTLIIMMGNVDKKKNSTVYIVGSLVILIAAIWYPLFYYVIPNTVGLHVAWIRQLCNIISAPLFNTFGTLKSLMPMMGIVAGYLSAHVSFKRR